MSGRRSGRLAAVTALLAFTLLAGGFIGLESGASLAEFDWGAPVAAIVAIHHP